MQSEEVTLAVGDEDFPGRLNVPDENTGHGILVLPGAGHGPFGDVFDRFGQAAADAGYEVARFETWSTREELEVKTDSQFHDEIVAGVDFLRSRGDTTVTIVAKSFGGRLALQLTPDLADRLVLWAPAIIFDGDEDVPSITAEELSTIDRPVRILQGDQDEVVSVGNATSITEHLPEGELVELPGEDHSFQNDQERVIEETLAFLPD